MKTFRERDLVIEIASSDKEEDPVNVDGSSKRLTFQKETPKEKPKEAIHGTMSLDTSQTKVKSILSDLMANPEQAFGRMCLRNPVLLTQFLKSNPDIKTVPPGESRTPSQKRILQKPLHRKKAMRHHDNDKSKQSNRTHMGTVWIET